MTRLTFNDLSTINQNRLKAWNNAFKLNVDIKQTLSWVKTHELKIADGIENHIQTSGKNKGKTYSTTTKRDYYNLLAQILDNQGQKNRAKVYRKFVQDLNNLHNQKEDNQELDDYELLNWTSHEDILTRLRELKGIYENDPTVSNGYKYLALAMYSLQPPIRNNYYNMQIAPETTKQATLLKRKTINYLHQKEDGYDVILNKDKVSKDRGSSVIPIESQELVDIINESLTRFPRKYLFSQIRNLKKPMSREYFGDIFMKNLLKDKNTGINNFRSSYISWFYKRNPGVKPRNDLAVKMRHSRAIAERVYNKIDTNDEIIEDIQDNEPIERPLRKSFDLKAWSKKYRKEHSEIYKASSKRYYDKKKKEILRKKIIKNVNSGNTDRPSDTSIQLYKLKYDDESKQWK